LNAGAIDLTEIELYENGTKLTGIITTTSFFSATAAARLTNETKSTADRSFNTNWSSVRATATISFDLGSAKSISALQVFSLYAQPRFPASFDLQASSDGVSYTTVATVTVGTSFTNLGGDVYASPLVMV
jgi:hypothetical protein